MRTINNSTIRKQFEIGLKTPIYHTESKVLTSVINNSSINTDRSTVKLHLESRPFDEMVVSVFIVTDPTLNKQRKRIGYFFVTHIFQVTLDNGDIVPATISECFNEEGIIINMEGQSEEWVNAMVSGVSRLFSHKKTKIYLSETPTIRPASGKTRSKKIKQKVCYISTDQIINSERNPSSGRVNSSYQTCKVAGHWRDILGKNGHDRNGKAVKNKTWIKPYTRGEGAEIMETIRQWR